MERHLMIKLSGTKQTHFVTTAIDEDDFEAMRADMVRLPTYTALTTGNGDYVTGYAYSPDGEGVVWYDTFADMVQATGC
jgi:hypothetical protein